MMMKCFAQTLARSVNKVEEKIQESSINDVTVENCQQDHRAKGLWCWTLEKKILDCSIDDVRNWNNRD